VFDPEKLVGTPRCGVREWPFTVVVSEKFSKKSGHGISEGGDKTNP
jgi:hypothetical protein